MAWGGFNLAKLIKIVIVVTCLVCVLAVFIAPLVDLPDTVRREYHTSNALDTIIVIDFALGVRGIDAVSNSLSERMTMPAILTPLQDLASQETLSIFRC
jgi:hypothetical protein